MSRLPCNIAGALALGALCGCAPGVQNLQGALSACERGAPHAEVYIPRASVVRVLGERYGRSGEHEGFVIRAAGKQFKIEDNVEITGPVPLHPGDTITLLGQLECDDEVIHWTHHDPRGHHISGYIEVNGKMYE